MATYLFSSHDGYGLGHARRNSLIAQRVLERDPDARITLVTGIAAAHWVFSTPGIRVVHTPPLVKDRNGAYRPDQVSFDEAIEVRRATFASEVEQLRPDVVVVDRHPYGVGGELRTGLATAKRHGATVVLGLRAVLDERDTVAAEIEGAGWAGVRDDFDEVLVYGSPVLCDHEHEYGLPLAPRYCGIVTDVAPPTPVDPSLMVVAAGGGADGQVVFGLGAAVLARRTEWRGVIAVGPYADRAALDAIGIRDDGRITVRQNASGTPALFASAGASIQMAGYNTTFEAIGAGIRPILVPRRTPRREQAIQASRLAALGLADVVDEGASAAEIEWLLDRPRRLTAGAVEAAGLTMDGADHAAQRLVTLARVAAPT